MGLFGFGSEEESPMELREKRERGALARKFEKFPIYFTTAVDFDYEIIDGGLYTWCNSGVFEEAHDEALLDLKIDAHDIGADALIDVKLTIATGNEGTVMDGTGDEFFIVHMTGIAVKRK